MTSREIALQEMTSPEISSQEMTSQEMTSQEITSREMSSRKVMSQKMTSRGMHHGIRWSGVRGVWCEIRRRRRHRHHHIFSLFLHLASYTFSRPPPLIRVLTFLPAFTYHLLYLSFSSMFSLPPLRSLFDATARAV